METEVDPLEVVTKKIKRKKLLRFFHYFFIFLIVIALSYGIYWLILEGYKHDFTGFNKYTIISSPAFEVIPQKFVWDWLDLLIIPVALLIFGSVFTYIGETRKRTLAEEDRQKDKAIAEINRNSEWKRLLDHQQEESLQNYIDKMTDLLLKEKLLLSEKKNEVRNVARVKTLATIRTLDGKRKGLVLKFLFDAGLINGEDPIIDIQFADFTNTDYKNAYLGNINLMNVDFSYSNLENVEFDKANLSKTNFTCASLREGIFSSTKFDKTIFVDTNFDGTTIKGSKIINTTFSSSLKTNIDNIKQKLDGYANILWEDCIFTDCSFQHLNFHSPQMNNVQFKSTAKNKTEFNDVNIIKGKMIGDVDFSGVKFRKVGFTGTEFIGTGLNITKFIFSEFYEVGFQNTYLTGVNFSDSTMNRVDFQNAIAHFERRTSEDTPMQDSIFSRVKMIENIKMNGLKISVDQFKQIFETKGILNLDELKEKIGFTE